ncbi:MAG: hypothetical protein A2096_07350 [Spirochaetes bacterium GWF1_41_5]|nr:MAG: hypothetical protein A2096_07350 [Spirochaetes bacterium GWF1_41_5]
MGTMDIALNIKKMREAKGFTLEALAKKTRVTRGFLSQVENFRALPSIPLLYQLAGALEVEPSALLTAVKQDSRFVLTKKGCGEIIEREYPESGYVYHALARGKNSKTMEPFLLKIPPHAARKSVVTNGDEFVYLLTGSVNFYLGEKKICLAAGDSLYFEGEIPHYSRNISSRPAVMLVVYSITY